MNIGSIAFVLPGQGRVANMEDVVDLHVGHALPGDRTTRENTSDCLTFINHMRQRHQCVVHIPVHQNLLPAPTRHNPTNERHYPQNSDYADLFFERQNRA